MKRLFVVVMALFLSASLFADAADVGKNLSVRIFQFKHKQADKAAAVIKPLMSAEGSMSIQPAANSLSVTDTPENMKRIAAALAQYDASPQPFQLSVRVLSARRAAAEESKIDSELSDVSSKLALMRFNVVEKLASAEVTGKEGEAGTVDLNLHRADFRFGEYDPASDTIQLTDFRLARLQGDQVAPMYKTTLNLKLGQTVIIGVTKDEKSQRALMVVLTAKR